MRTWCNWCSIADFSSVRTGSSPVVRYLISSENNHGKTDYLRIVHHLNVMSCRLFFSIYRGYIWYYSTVWKKSRRYEKLTYTLRFRDCPYLTTGLIWCNSHKFAYRKSRFIHYCTDNAIMRHGEMAERSIASDCKSDASRLRRFKSYSPQT